MWQLSLPATEEFLWNCSHRSLMRLKLLKKYVFHPEQYSKSRNISVHKELTYKGERWNIYTPQVYTQFHHCRAWYFTQPYNFVTLWYSLVNNFSLCGYLSPVSLENYFSDSSNSYSNCLWRLPRNASYTDQVYVQSRAKFSPVPHCTGWVWSAGGCGNGTSWRIWLETLEPWHAAQNLSVWGTGLSACYPGNLWAPTNQWWPRSKKSMPMGRK